MNFDVDQEKLVSLETMTQIEDLVSELFETEKIKIRYDQISDLQDDIYEAIRIQLRKYT